VTVQRVCSVQDVPDAAAFRVDVPTPTGDTVPVAVVRDSGGDLHAISDICSHQDVSLSEGEVDDCAIECWLHGSRFDLRTGAPSSLPATRPIPVYRLTVEGDDVLVDVDVSPADESADETADQHATSKES
jgi:3-phenylpropionate/trans-cinnamate dioxygenase ferredoxin component